MKWYWLVLIIVASAVVGFLIARGRQAYLNDTSFYSYQNGKCFYDQKTGSGIRNEVDIKICEKLGIVDDISISRVNEGGGLQKRGCNCYDKIGKGVLVGYICQHITCQGGY